MTIASPVRECVHALLLLLLLGVGQWGRAVGAGLHVQEVDVDVSPVGS